MGDSNAEPNPLDLIAVTGGAPTAEEAAAAKVVVEGMLREGGSVDNSREPSRWSESARTGRVRVERGIDAWEDLTT